ncbi:HDOD domain-containing protein [Pseudoalteromonas sp. Of7M-16]|uniref:HDOD domain-containing protein n=1 Tax=Pseudoalteromonas sp. Of7M-16 TaxID=2917756 RepID=UPI001EF49DB8|nr:HDOD domain-containing protein [Pseudoalteromonas sp. Of7M-16]MCG7549666.1 HDOD domain-containing protein [Pseudoalteromonas sp. Of7M-16]
MTQDIRQSHIAKAIAQRAHDVLISHNFAQQQIGYIHTFDMNFGESIPQRTMLEVELAAAAKRQEKSTSHHKYIAKASNHLHQVIESGIETQLSDLDSIYTDVVGVQDAVPTVLDILAVKSASVGRLEPLVNDLSWLGRDLVSLVNLPQYRKVNSKGTSVKVDTPALALRYLGLENLQMVIPTFAVRHWMPHSTEPFPLLKRKLRDVSMASAIAAKALAPLYDVKEQHAFTLGMLLDLGKIALTRLYLRTFERVWQAKVKIARDKNQKDLHTALLELGPDPLFLRNLLLEHAAVVSQRLIEQMSFKYLPFNAAMSEFAQSYLPDVNNNTAELLPLTQVLKKAYGYAQYQLLKDSHLIEPDEAKDWFIYLNLTDKEEKLLEKTSLQSLQLTIL